MSKFISSKVNIETGSNIVIENHDVGIVVSSAEKESDIFFIRLGINAQMKNSDFEIIDIKKTGDSFDKKICNVCHKLLDTKLFNKNQNAKNNRPVRRPSCKDCRIVIEGVDLKSSDVRMWKKSKPHLEPYECPICNKRTIPGLTSKVVLDHDHNTGKPRAWICDSCNTGLGRFKDDINLLKKAISYLQKD